MKSASLIKAFLLSTAVIMSAAMAAGTAHAGRTSTIKDLRYSTTTGYTRVVLELTSDTNFSVNRLRNPDRLYIDLRDSRIKAGKERSMKVGDGLLGSIRYAQFEKSTVRVVMEMEPGNTYKVFRLKGPPRVVVDFFRKDTGTDGIKEPAGGNNSETMELARRKLKALERRKAELKASLDAKKGKASTKAKPSARERMASVAPPSPPSVAAGSATSGALLAANEKKSRADEARKLDEARAKVLARSSKDNRSAPKQVVKKNKEKRKPAKRRRKSGKFNTYRVVIDAGHGGKDPGALGRGGLKEKVIVLDIAKRVKRKLEKKGGYKVILTRSRDKYLELEDRARIANKKDADIFVSIHANASRNRRARGLETYYLNKNSDEDTIKIAARENAVPIEMMRKAIDTTNFDYILASMATQRKQYESADLAKRVRESMYSSLTSRYHGVTTKKSSMGPFYVLYGARMPAVLVEVSYITNKTEASRLRTSTYRDYLARGIAEGIKEYLRNASTAADLAKR